jgi:hypothetical protein
MAYGMLSGTIVLEGESKDRFQALLAALHEELQPQTPIETSLVENMAVARWRQMRIWGMEKAGMEHEMRRQAEASQSTRNRKKTLRPDRRSPSAPSATIPALSNSSTATNLVTTANICARTAACWSCATTQNPRPPGPPANPSEKLFLPNEPGKSAERVREIATEKQERQLFVFIRVYSWPKTVFYRPDHKILWNS